MAEGVTYSARTIVLATGVEDVLPDLPGVHDAIRTGIVRLCPVCDAYEAIDRNILVLGNGEASIQKAIFLRRYSTDVAYLHQSTIPPLSETQEAQLKSDGIEVLDAQGAEVELRLDAVGLRHGRRSRTFDVAYLALGSRPRCDLALSLGIQTGENDCLKIGLHQETSVQGLFAAGDVVAALDQIGVAVGTPPSPQRPFTIG